MNSMELRAKMKSVANISHIVHSMETMATMKIMKLRTDAEKRKIYSQTLQQILSGMINLLTEELPENKLLDTKTKDKQALLLLFSSDRGFSGNMTPMLLGQSREFLRLRPGTRVLCIGKKAGNTLIKENFNVLAMVDKKLENVDFYFAQSLASDVVKGFLNQEFDSVYVSYMEFTNILKQRPVIRKIIPIEKIPTITTESKKIFPYESYIISPSPKSIFSFLVRKYMDAIVFQMLLEAAASEQAIRMMSMKSASDNAEKVLHKMKTDYQKMRQEKITRELIELSTNANFSKETR
jgi:F-type H+-transporting ATPase subunit gamma